MLSNLISSKNITTDENELDKWLAHSSQEIADNVKILSYNVWNTYWNDGKINRSLNLQKQLHDLEPDWEFYSKYLSMTDGIITGMTNPSTGNVVVTSLNHGPKMASRS